MVDRFHIFCGGPLIELYWREIRKVIEDTFGMRFLVFMVVPFPW